MYCINSYIVACFTDLGSLTPEGFSPEYLCVLLKVAQKNIFPIYLNCTFFEIIFPSIYTYLEYDVLWGNRISFTTEKKKISFIFNFCLICMRM